MSRGGIVTFAASWGKRSYVALPYHGHRFPPVVIQHVVWLYMRFTLSLRDVEDMLAERGLDLSYETVRRWSANSARCSRATFGGGGHAQLRAGTWTRW